jgi:type IV fimbrial biogenesis protein FimT
MSQGHNNGRQQPAHRKQCGFTLVELMIVIAVLAVIATLAAPSFNNFILTQRLKAISAQFATDVQFARTEAVSRNQEVRLRFQDNANESCYVIFTGANNNACICIGATVCLVGAQEIRTVRVPQGLGVKIAAVTSPPDFRVDPANTGILIDIGPLSPGSPDIFTVNIGVDNARTLRTVVNLSGRTSVCVPSGSHIAGVAC